MRWSIGPEMIGPIEAVDHMAIRYKAIFNEDYLSLSCRP